ncbi:hypothetical protein BDN72DRAFT_334956 [Pluteus cervinus]|uniref:Uncharacterized protein n=1 Tax=Pluteus cervinus TaxID=181527 RepID=A0ACD3B2W4_9AGAR|nr:hypothetical protein BDN72DRAFT_334956 [Pluteus cervinus]
MSIALTNISTQHSTVRQRSRMASTSTAAPTFHCDCPHGERNHFLSRCGCPNTRPSNHPMSRMDDAFHRMWCTDCLGYCSQDPACQRTSATTDQATRKLHQKIYATLVRLKRTIVSCLQNIVRGMKSWKHRIPLLTRTRATSAH